MGHTLCIDRLSTPPARGLLPARLPRPSRAGDAEAWLLLYGAARIVATVIAAVLVGWQGMSGVDAFLLLYGIVSTMLLLALPELRGRPAVWAIDVCLTLAFVLQSGDWRSPYYLLWLTSLALPATALPMRRAGELAVGASLAYLLVAILGGPVPGRLQLVSTETLAIHVSLPFMLVAALAYAAEAMRRLAVEQSARERLAIEAERKRIAWELHDSAKQRLHAAHLLVTSLHGRVPAALDKTVSRAAVELESAASDMDTSLAELRSPLEGRRLDEALRSAPTNWRPPGSRGSTSWAAPRRSRHWSARTPTASPARRSPTPCAMPMPPRSRSRWAPATARFHIAVHDDGRGLPAHRRRGPAGCWRWRTVPPPSGRGSPSELRRTGSAPSSNSISPLDHNGGTP